MTWAAYGRGSYFAGAPDPKDVDVLVVTTELLSRREATERVLPLLDDLPPSLPLDVSVLPPDTLSIWARAVTLAGVHLGGDDIRPTVRRPTWPEWAYFMHWWFTDVRQSDPAAAALAAIRGALAPTAGILALSKSLVPPAAAGTPWESLANAAWEYRGRPGGFDHPDLEAAGRASDTVCAGDAYGAVGRAAVAVVYRCVLDADRLCKVATGNPTDLEQSGGWRKGAWLDPHMGESLFDLGNIANAWWWGQPIDGYEQVELHRHLVGSEFPPHVDHQEVITAAERAAFPGVDLELLRTRSTNVIGLLQAADKGGLLQVWDSEGPMNIDLAAGDVVVVDSSARHGVTRVDAGERLVLVTHTHTSHA